MMPFNFISFLNNFILKTVNFQSENFCSVAELLDFRKKMQHEDNNDDYNDKDAVPFLVSQSVMNLIFI